MLRVDGGPEGQRPRRQSAATQGLGRGTGLVERQASAHTLRPRTIKRRRRPAACRETHNEQGCPARIRTSTNWSRASRAAVTPPGRAFRCGKESNPIRRPDKAPASLSPRPGCSPAPIERQPRVAASLRKTPALAPEVHRDRFKGGRLPLTLLLLDPRPRVLQCDGTIEDRGAGGRVLRVGVEIAEPLELVLRVRDRGRQRRLELAPSEGLQ